MKYCVTIALSYSLCIGGLAAQDIISTFSAGSEDWLVVDLPDLGPYNRVYEYFTPVFLEAGGNPGGHVAFDDPSQCCSYFFDAPAAFLGDRTASCGLRLSFDLRTAVAGGPYPLPDVVLEGGDGLVLTTLAGPDPTTLWRTYRVTLRETAGWRINDLNGRRPTHDEFMGVLSYLVSLRIRGDHVGGPDTSYLDNVVLESGPRLTFLRDANQTLILSWRGVGTLEQTDSLTAPNWQPAPSQANPQTISTTDPMKFYRVKAD